MLSELIVKVADDSSSPTIQRAMESLNSSIKEEYNKTIQVLFCTARSSGSHWIFNSAINSFFSFTAILGNTLILVALHKETSLHPPSKLLYRCLAVTDLLVGLITQPSTALYSTSLVTELRLTDLCFYSAAICTVSFTTLSAVSLLTMTTISVDRFLALFLGLQYRTVVTLRRVRALVIFFWIPSIAFASTSFWQYAIPKVYNFTLIILCLFISACCFSKIFLKLRQHGKQVEGQAHHTQPNGAENPLNIARYRKTVYTAVWVEITLVFCYLPYSIVIAIITLNGSSSFLDVIWALTASLVCLNSSFNPILYCWKIREVRQEVKKTIRQVLCLST